MLSTCSWLAATDDGSSRYLDNGCFYDEHKLGVSPENESRTHDYESV